MKHGINHLGDSARVPSCHPQVGAPDPARHCSPIVEPGMAILDALDNAWVHGCIFNDAPHAIGDIVQSGHDLLRCEAPGVWVRQAPP
jgi:hypothetical protein